MTGTLRTIHAEDYKGDVITYYEMDIKFKHAFSNYTYFSLEGETKEGFTERISYEIRKLYNGSILHWVEDDSNNIIIN